LSSRRRPPASIKPHRLSRRYASHDIKSRHEIKPNFARPLAAAVSACS
jgi:hypothetical protein